MSRSFPGGASVTDYLATGNTAVFNFNTNVCYWAMVRATAFNATSGYNSIIHAGTGSTGVLVYITNAGLLAMEKQGAGGPAIVGTATTSVVTGEWYAVQMQTGDGAVGGKLKRWRYSTTSLGAESVAQTGTFTTPSTTPCYVGQWASLGANFVWNGLIARVVALQADPTDGEFQAWAETGAIPTSLTAAVRGHWVLDNTSPTADLSPNGNSLTVNGTTYSTDEPPLLPAGAVQTARPSTDTTRDNWEEDDGTTTAIFDQLDETIADDADYIRTGMTPTNDVYVTKLTAVTDPVVHTGHILRYRYGKAPSGSAQIDMTVQLRQDYENESTLGSLIREWTHTNVASGWTLATQTLIEGEAAAISNYGNLFIRVIANSP